MADQQKVIDDATRWDNINKKTFHPSHRESHYAEEKEKLFPRGSLVVDIGGGAGEDALYFLKKGHSVIFLDISPEALRVAEEKVKAENLLSKIVFKRLDYGLERFPVKDSSVDVVYSRLSLHYFDRQHTIRLFADIFRILKNGASAYLSFKSPEDKEEIEYLENISTVYEENVYIENGILRSRFTKNQLEEILQSAGITDFNVSPFTESLAGRRTDHRQTLYLNDIVFKKI
jgi:ubiquinone/menaquinone biosynthesis C-methylase UbiE